MQRIAASILVGGLAFLAPAGAQSRTDAEYVSERWGFRVIRPGPGWTIVERETSGDREWCRIDLTLGNVEGIVGARVSVTSHTDGDATSIQRESAESARRRQNVSDVRLVEVPIGDRSAPGIDLRYRDPDLGEYRLRQFYVVREGLRYTLQCHAPAGQFDEREHEFARFLASFELQPLCEELVDRARLESLVARCGSEIDWAASWAAASARAASGQRPVLVLVRRYPGFAIPDEMRIGPFMDRDIVELVQERFVALRLEDGMPAPFRGQSSYGMSGTTFGNALLVVSPAGEVLRETHTPNVAACYDFLVESLAHLPGFPGSPEPEGLSCIERAERALRRGELAAAADLCAKPSTAREHLALAGVHRRQRNTAAALAELARARTVRDEATDLQRLRLDEAWLELRAGDPATARASLVAPAGDSPDAETAREAEFLTAICSLAEGNWDAGFARLRGIVAEHPDARWAWSAAAILASPTLDRTRPLPARWPDEQLVAELRTPPPAASGAPLADVARDALAFLLAAQRPEGSWISPTELQGVRAGSNPFVVAITALAGRALLQRREAEGATAGAERALGFVLAAQTHMKTSPPRVTFMDYTVWSESLALWFLADCIDAGVGDAAAARAVMREKVGVLAGKQRPSGGWSYYVTADLAREAAVPAQAMSFTTAAVVIGLCRARDAGVAVEQLVVDAALDCLERGRNENGAFDYLIGSTPGAGRTGVAGAAGRGPLCELALLRGGRGSLDALRRALAAFAEHRASFDKELGKVLMHAGPDGQGCHYLFFDYATAATAVAALPEPERAHHREWLLELVLPARSVDGGFRDTPINGWAFGTAMALTALFELGAG
ncbi:MAG: hypothetical protein IPM29_28730 [Planctomycetes bacterium]|nr:hypothetical protein [Planctomycetota bacterium]